MPPSGPGSTPSLTAIGAVPDVAAVGSPYGDGGQISAQGDVGYAELTFADVDTARIEAAVAAIDDIADQQRGEGLTVDFAGGGSRGRRARQRGSSACSPRP